MKRTFLLLASLVIATGVAHAEMFDVTGDLAIGPARDYLKPSVLCKTADPFFSLYERFANGSSPESVEEFMRGQVKQGVCKETPAATAYVNAIKMAKISGTERPAASLYTLAKVTVEGRNYYVMPQALGQTGFEIIKRSQLQNKRNVTPLVQ
jgi:hypothetical protein